MIGWLAAAAALGCGGMFGPDGAEVYSDGQQVLFEQGDGYVDVEYLVDYGGELDDFGWVIPIPGAFVELSEGDPARFDDLAEATFPDVRWHASDRGRGCGGANKGGALRGGTDGLVLAQGTAGVFEFAVLDGTSTAAVTAWLEARGWSVTEQFDALQGYTGDEGWQFVAIRLQEEVAPDAPEVGGRTTARIRYEGSRMSFPARMSRYSSAPEQRTTIYAVGGERASLNGWHVVDLPEGDFVGEWRFEDALREAVAGEETYAVTFADEVDGSWITRFDTLAPSGVHTDDAHVRFDSGIVTWRPTIDVWESEEDLERARREGGCASAPARAGLPWWILASLGLARRRYRARSTTTSST